MMVKVVITYRCALVGAVAGLMRSVAACFGTLANSLAKTQTQNLRCGKVGDRLLASEDAVMELLHHIR